MRQLRTDFSLPDLIEQIKEQRLSGYQVAYGEQNQEVVCVAGFVIGTKLAWGKHMYIDDLVTEQGHRSSGMGSAMLNWLKSYAQTLGCAQLHLDSGVQRFAAHRFYLRQGFNIASHHFSIADLRGGH